MNFFIYGPLLAMHRNPLLIYKLMHALCRIKWGVAFSYVAAKNLACNTISEKQIQCQCEVVFWVALVFSLQQVYLVYIFATVSQYCLLNVKFIDISLSLITISLFIF